MKTQALRWGLLSTARINRALLTPLRRSRRNCLVAVASRSQEKAEAYARQYHIPRACGSYEALLADAEIDVIYNPLPNHLHAEWTIRALKAGKHVLCEKPLALSEQEVTAIMVAAREHQRVVAEAFMYRSHAQTQKVREIVASVPGGVHTDLLALKRIPDPFVADNEHAVQWVGVSGSRWPGHAGNRDVEWSSAGRKP